MIGTSRNRLTMSILLAGFLSGCTHLHTAAPPPQPAPTSMVAAAHPLAAAAGLEALRQGGNAMDAAVATSFALGVVEPYGSGLGGGAFLVYYDAAGQRTSILNFRERAPAALPRDETFEAGRFEGKNFKRGSLSVAVPGQVRGLVAAHQRFGHLDWGKLLQAALRYADEGFLVSETLHGIMSKQKDIIANHPPTASIFLQVDLAAIPAGVLLMQPELAGTLMDVQHRGEQALYDSRAAQTIAGAVQAEGGILTAEDLTRYRPVWTNALKGSYHGYEILTMGPPSQGGVIILQTLGILEAFDLSAAMQEPATYYGLLLAAMEQAYLTTSSIMADPNFVDLPMEEILSEDWILQARNKIIEASTLRRPGDWPQAKAGPSRHSKAQRRRLAAGNLPGDTTYLTTLPSETPDRIIIEADSEAGSTSHFSIIDAAGNMATVTQTINYHFGSGLIVPGMGFLLNNEMDDFTFDPQSNNRPEPGKMPRSSMAPLLVVKDGLPVGTLGTPGGWRIPSTLIQILINKIDFNQSLDDAIEAPRVFYHPIRKVLYSEDRIPKEIMNQAAQYLQSPENIEHVEKPAFDPFFGGAQGIWINRTPGHPTTLEGGADSRRDGVALGF